MGDFSSGKKKRKGEDKGCKIMKRKWTPKEDAVLISALGELCNAGWKRENGIFKNGYTAALEAKLKSRIPNCSIKASPHIESRLKLLKRQYDAITEMQGSAGMRWDNKLNILTCEDDDVWEKWIQTHIDAKALRNKQFPYYNDLHLLFGNRGTKKGANNDELDDDEKVFDVDDDNATGNLMVRDSLDDDERGDYEGSYGKEDEPRSDNNNGVGDNSLIKKRKMERECRILPDQSQSDDSAGTNPSCDENRWADASENQHHASTTKVLNKNSYVRESESSELGKLANIFGNFLDKYQNHLSLLTEIVGKEASAEKIAGEKRARLNGELKKLHNLNLQARLRAASLIVTDPAKLDLFYSLSKEERGEWVSMLLTGLI